MSDLISVIIPVYNAESRITYTLNSITAQDYSELEIILVDDASTDDTGKIARSLLSSSGRKFSIITHEHNSGECASRNTGLEHSMGKYVCFIDADDMIQVNFISSLYKCITENNCNISFCGLLNRFTDGRPDKLHHPSSINPFIESGEKFILSNIIPSVWCCMYEYDFLNKYNLRFHEGCTAGGDIEFITKALCRAESVSFIREYLYIYMHHPEMGSIRDNNTITKNLLRYEHNTYAQIRTAEYLSEHSKSYDLRKFAHYILMPQSTIRLFTLNAERNNINEYNLMLQDNNNREILGRAVSFYTLVKKPEIFIKALTILYAPKLYYELRQK